MPAPPPPQNQMVVPKLRTQNGSTSLGEKSDEQETRAMLAAGQCRGRFSMGVVIRRYNGKVVEEFSATYGIYSYQSCM